MHPHGRARCGTRAVPVLQWHTKIDGYLASRPKWRLTRANVLRPCSWSAAILRSRVHKVGNEPVSLTVSDHCSVLATGLSGASSETCLAKASLSLRLRRAWIVPAFGVGRCDRG